MGTYQGKQLVIRRDGNGTVVYDGTEIGRVSPDPADTRVQARDWRYQHVSGTTLSDLHPDWTWPRTSQTAMGMREAARDLAWMHEQVLVIPTRDGISYLLTEAGLAPAVKSGAGKDRSSRAGFIITVLRPGVVAVRYSADDGKRDETTRRYADVITTAGYSVAEAAEEDGGLIVSSGPDAGQ